MTPLDPSLQWIAIISDTHGYLERIDTILERTKGWPIIMWLHAGDYGDDADYVFSLVTVPVKKVSGNNDRKRPLAPVEELIPYEDTYIYMTHGDRLPYYKRERELRFIANHYKAKLIVLGHSHKHKAEYITPNTLVINPGSLALPRDGSKGSMACVAYDGTMFHYRFFGSEPWGDLL